MATAAIAGYSGFLHLGTTGAAIKIAELREWTISAEMAEIDATSHDSSGIREVIAGIRSWSGSAEYLFAGDSSGQLQVHDLWNAGTLLSLEFYPAGTSTSFPYYSGVGYLTGWEASGPNEDAIATNISFVGTGTLAQTTA